MDSFFFTLFLIHYKILVEVIVILLIIYPKCSTCIKAKKYLEDKSISFDIRDIVLDKLNVDELKKYINLSKLDINRFFNTSGMKYRELGLKDKMSTLTDDEKLKLLASDGMLVKRPILVCDNKVLVGFKEKEWSEIK